MAQRVNIPRNVSQDEVRSVQRMDTAALETQVEGQYDRINHIIEAGRDPEQGNRVCFDRAVASGEFDDKKASDLREEMIKLRGLADVGSRELIDRAEVEHASAVTSRPLPSRKADMSPVTSEVRDAMARTPGNILAQLTHMTDGVEYSEVEKLLKDAYAGNVGGSLMLNGINPHDFHAAVVKVGDATGVDVRRVREGPVQMLAYEDVMLSDLLPMVQCGRDTDSYVFARETLKDNAMATKAEGASFAEQDVASAPHTVTVKKVGGYVTVTKEQLADVAVAESYINALIREKFRQKWGEQVVEGDNTGDNMNGLFTQAGKTQSGRTQSTTSLLSHMLTAISKLWKESYIRPDIVAVNYSDMATLMTTATTQGEFVFGDPHKGMPNMLWGVPMIASNQVPSNKALAMKTSDAFLVVKGVAEIETGWANDDILKQQRRIVISGRGNVGVRRPNSIISIDTTPHS